MKSTLVLLFVTSMAVFFSFLFDKMKTMEGLKKGIKMLLNLVPPILTILIFVSSLLYFVPQDVIVQWLGKDSGIRGVSVAAIVGSISLIPGFVAFPLCNILLKSGASYSIIATFITTLMMVGTLTLPMEIKYFGVKVSLFRNILSSIGAVLIGLLIGLLWRML